MGFVTRSLKLILFLFIFYIAMGMLHSNGISIFGGMYYTELGFVAFMFAIFLDVTFSFGKW